MSSQKRSRNCFSKSNDFQVECGGERNLGQLGDLLPLLLRGINTSGIVGTGVEEDHGLLGGSLEILNQTLEVKSTGLGIIVSVVLDLNARVIEDGDVVSPGWVGDINSLGGLVELGQELGSNPEGTSSRDRLAGGDLRNNINRVMMTIPAQKEEKRKKQNRRNPPQKHVQSGSPNSTKLNQKKKKKRKEEEEEEEEKKISRRQTWQWQDHRQAPQQPW